MSGVDMSGRNLGKKLQLARVKLQAVGINKSGQNKFRGFKYYELSDFIPKINEIFAEVGLYSCFKISNQEAILTIYSDDTDESLAFTSHIADIDSSDDKRMSMSPIQKLGAVHTYMRRYLYMNALEITEPDIIDAADKTIPTKQHVQSSADVKSVVKSVPPADVKPDAEEIEIMDNIDKITTVEALNNVYQTYLRTAKNDKWKKPLFSKSRQLNAEYDKNFNEFMVNA